MSETSATAMAVEPAAETPATATGNVRSSVGKALRRPSTLVWLGWIALVVVASALASVLAPYDPLAQDLGSALQPPSAQHWFGTDELGRDLLSRLLHGGGELLLVALIPLGVSFAIGIAAGLYVGYVGGRADAGASFLVNVTFSIPMIVVILAVAAISSSNLVVLALTAGVLSSGGIVRLVRSLTVSARERAYVDAARVAALPRRRILARHILPNIAAPLIVQAFLLYGGTFLFLTSLSFLGLGFNPETPSWGQMIFDANQHLFDAPWMTVPIGAVVTLTVIALNFIGMALLRALPTATRGQLLGARRGRLARRRERPMHPGPLTRTTDTDEAPADVRSRSEQDDNDGLLNVDGLTIALRGEGGRRGQVLVDDVSFTLRRAETVGLVGESGSGKTLTSLAVLGLLPPGLEVVSGRVVFEGRDLVTADDEELRRLRGNKIAYVSQEPMVALDPTCSVGSLLRASLRIHAGLSGGQARNRTLELLRLVEIPNPEAVARSYPHQLSGGMAQRVGIALALSGDPTLLVADEPTTALDVTVQADILDLLRSLQERLSMSVLIVTHDLGVVSDICDRVAVMYAGQIVESGTTEEVLLRPHHPYTQGLVGAMPEATSGADLRTIPGAPPRPQDWAPWCRFEPRCPLAADVCRAGPPPVVDERGRTARCVRLTVASSSVPR